MCNAVHRACLRTLVCLPLLERADVYTDEVHDLPVTCNRAFYVPHLVSTTVLSVYGVLANLVLVACGVLLTCTKAVNTLVVAVATPAQ